MSKIKLDLMETVHEHFLFLQRRKSTAEDEKMLMAFRRHFKSTTLDEGKTKQLYSSWKEKSKFHKNNLFKNWLYDKYNRHKVVELYEDELPIDEKLKINS